MKFRKPLISTLTVGALFFAGTLLAQDTPPPPPPPAASTTAAPGQPMNNAAPNNAAPQAQVTVQSAQPPAPSIGPAPSFEQLSGGGKWITADQASAYPPLANDFLNASHNGTRVSKSQYEHWVQQLQ
ncbi:MAG: hypothetical protein ACREPQ_20505 [Rhodanobacter sp.]